MAASDFAAANSRNHNRDRSLHSFFIVLPKGGFYRIGLIMPLREQNTALRLLTLVSSQTLAAAKKGAKILQCNALLRSPCMIINTYL